jgi:hypothetical protein
MATNYNVRKTGAGEVITWKGKPLHVRINQDGLNADRRTRIVNAFEDMCPRIGSGFTHDGQTFQKPNSGQEAAGLDPVTNVYVWAKAFTGDAATAVAWADPWWVGTEYKGAVVVFNTLQYPSWDLAHFKTFCWHEVGHVGGLQHCNATDQVMCSAPYDQPYRSGDLAGFAVLKAAR